MRKGMISFFLVFFSLFSVSVQASPTIYVVDMQRVVNESATAISAKTDLEEDVKKSRSLIEKQQLEFRQQQEAMKRQAAILSGSALENKQAELQKKEIALRRTVLDQKQELVRKSNLLVERISNEANKVMKQLAKERGYGFIIEKGQHFVVYADKDLDLTDQVIKLLDEKKIKF